MALRDLYCAAAGVVLEEIWSPVHLRRPRPAGPSAPFRRHHKTPAEAAASRAGCGEDTLPGGARCWAAASGGPVDAPC